MDNFYRFLANRLPHKLVHSAFMRVFAYGTSGKHGKQVVPRLTCITALDRWDKQ